MDGDSHRRARGNAAATRPVPDPGGRPCSWKGIWCRRARHQEEGRAGLDGASLRGARADTHCPCPRHRARRRQRARGGRCPQQANPGGSDEYSKQLLQVRQGQQVMLVTLIPLAGTTHFPPLKASHSASSPGPDHALSRHIPEPFQPRLHCPALSEALNSFHTGLPSLSFVPPLSHIFLLVA